MHSTKPYSIILGSPAERQRRLSPLLVIWGSGLCVVWFQLFESCMGQDTCRDFTTGRVHHFDLHFVLVYYVILVMTSDVICDIHLCYIYWRMSAMCVILGYSNTAVTRLDGCDLMCQRRTGLRQTDDVLDTQYVWSGMMRVKMSTTM